MGIGNAFALGVERIIEPVEGMHTVIADRWLGAMGRAGRRARHPYTAMIRLVYDSVRLGATAVGVGIDSLVSVAPPARNAIQGWTNGLFGDGLGRHDSRLATQMTVRRDDSVVTGRLVVLVHGLGRTESCWEGNEIGPGLAQVLAADPELTPVPICYNTGLPVAVNGARMGDMLEQLVSAWPIPVESIALVGHSMGGLVIAEALVSARHRSQRWVEAVSDVVAIATPYRGAPLEKLVVAAVWGLGIAKTTRPLADFLEGRSGGIKDLGFAMEPLDEVVPPPYRHHLIAGVATSNPLHPMGSVIGDWMVRPASSTTPRGIEPDSTVVLGGVTHFDILNNSEVIEHVMTWLAPGRTGLRPGHNHSEN
jgi:pimeloyl-ACP methyl ester carboxylesterase